MQLERELAVTGSDADRDADRDGDGADVAAEASTDGGATSPTEGIVEQTACPTA